MQRVQMEVLKDDIIDRYRPLCLSEHFLSEQEVTAV
jgi:hypothetical protein